MMMTMMMMIAFIILNIIVIVILIIILIVIVVAIIAVITTPLETAWKSYSYRWWQLQQLREETGEALLARSPNFR